MQLTILIICITLNAQAVRVIFMYVCLCKGVTDRQIRRAIEEGADSLRALRAELGVMTQCGKCGCTTKELLNQTLDELNSCRYYQVA